MEARCWRLAPAVLLLLSLLFTGGAAVSDRSNYLEILPAGANQTRAVGSSIILTCKPRVADTKLISDIQWIDPQNRVIESLNHTPGYSKPSMYTEIHQDNSMSLLFNSLKEEQAGRYICKATYANSDLLTREVNIDTIVAITWDDAPENQFPILGDDFAIKCQVRARPSPTVDWLYNGEVIRTNDHYVIETHALRIKNVKESDDGIYTCRASVPETGELQERTIRVEVHTRPTIEDFENPIIEVIEGDNANIVCKGAGKPPPKFSWTKSLSKENLAITDRFAVNEDTGVLTITNVRREDSSEYECRAENAAGFITTNIQVNVIVKPKIMEVVNQTVPEGQSVTISCKAFGRPPPTITFRKHTTDKPYTMGRQSEDDRIILSNNVDDQKGETVAELTIDKTLRSNDGMYECIASNKGGMAFKNGHLTIEFAPSFASMNNRTIYSWDQRSVNLTCIAESIPNATITWTYFGEQRVENDPQIKIYDNGAISSLHVTPLDRRYYTQYKCIAKNKHGVKTHSIELREAPKPSDIAQVQMIETTATTISFNIVPPIAPDDLPIRMIHVQYKEQDENWSAALNRTWAAGNQGSYVVENLKPQTNYEFRFAAANDAGRGNWGMNKKFSTTMRSIPGPPRFLNALEGGDYAISHFHDKYNLKWSAAPDNGERIDYYEVKWCEAKRYSGDQWEVQESSCRSKQETKQEIWINYLYPDTFYKIELRAHNMLGLGHPLNVTIKTTRESEGFVVEEKITSAGVAIQLAVNVVAATLMILSLTI